MKTAQEYKTEAKLRRDFKLGRIGIEHLFGGKSSSVDERLSVGLKKSIDEMLPKVASDLIEGFLTNEKFMLIVAKLVAERIEPPKDGKDYILTEADKKEIAKSINVPVVEKIIEKRTQTIVKDRPIVTEITKVVPSNIDGAMIVDLINKLPIKPDLQIDASHIKGLKDKREGAQMGGGISRGGLKLIWGTELDGLVNSSNTVYTIPTTRPSPVDDKYIISVRGVLKTADNGDFTVSNNNRTITFTSAPPTGSDSPRIILYQSH